MIKYNTCLLYIGKKQYVPYSYAATHTGNATATVNKQEFKTTAQPTLSVCFTVSDRLLGPQDIMSFYELPFCGKIPLYRCDTKENKIFPPNGKWKLPNLYLLLSCTHNN